MKIMLDKSAHQIQAGAEKYNIQFEQLRTPLTQYRRDPLGMIPYGLDNGAYSDFNEERWLRMVEAAQGDVLCKWIVMPDRVGDAEYTTSLFNEYREHFINCAFETDKLAYVIQNGVRDEMIPWDKINCIFVGGDDLFKDGQLARDICIKAKALGLQVHVGRVNGPQRFVSWFDFADSVDGSGLAKYTHSLERLVRVIRSLENTTQTKLF